MAGVATLVYHDDGKEKWQSHEVYLKYPMIYEGFEFSNRGYGETKEEAYQDFIEKYNTALKNLEAFNKLLLESDALEMLEVDCMGEPIFRLNEERYGKACSMIGLGQYIHHSIYLAVGKIPKSGDVDAMQTVLRRVDNDKFYFDDYHEPLLAKDYGITWQVFKSDGRIYK